MLASPQAHLTSEDYLQIEADSPLKHEYRDDDVFAMAGASDRHVTIALNLAVLLLSVDIFFPPSRESMQWIGD